MGSFNVHRSYTNFCFIFSVIYYHVEFYITLHVVIIVVIITRKNIFFIYYYPTHSYNNYLIIIFYYFTVRFTSVNYVTVKIVKIVINSYSYNRVGRGNTIHLPAP